MEVIYNITNKTEHPTYELYVSEETLKSLTFSKFSLVF